MTAALWSWLLAIVVYDFQQRRVPNWLLLFGSALATIALTLQVQPMSLEWPEATLSAIAAFVFLLIFYVTGLMGAGDVKFGAALGLWVGLQPLAPIWIVSSLLAAVHALLWLALQRWPFLPRLAAALSGMPTSGHGDPTTRRPQRHIPFAAYLAIGTMGWLIWRNQNF